MSKYDDYWRKKLDNVLPLIDEVYKYRLSSELDVEDIREEGERKSWCGTTEVSKGMGPTGNMVVIKSLAWLLQNNG